MKIVHVSVVREFTPGQKTQLAAEHQCAMRLSGHQWDTVGYHDGPPIGGFIFQTPKVFRSVFLRKLWAWLILLRLSFRNDYVLLRHLPFDPFSPFFSWFVRNYVSVHHAKTAEELRVVKSDWRGAAASLLERITCWFSAYNSVAILGVTREIADYVCQSNHIKKLVGVYSNGVDPDSIRLLDDCRLENRVEVAFICGNFSSWHGLDKLLRWVDDQWQSSMHITIHLIGRLTKFQEMEMVLTEARRAVFKYYGVLDPEVYRSILARCDLGLSSFALERKELYEAATLKVREMLAMGLPVYSGHRDDALVGHEDFAMVTDEPSILEILKFANRVKSISRAYIRSESLGSVDKLHAMERVLTLLEGLRGRRI